MNKTGCCFYYVTSELQEKHENITRKVDTLKMYIKKISSLTLEDLADKLIGRVRSFVEENMSGKLEYLNVSSSTVHVLDGSCMAGRGMGFLELSVNRGVALHPA